MPRLTAAPIVVVLAILAGCAGAPIDPVATPTDGLTTPVDTPTATLEPRGPVPLDELTLSTEGLGDLELGQPARDDPELGLVHLDPVACTDEVTGSDLGIEEGSPLAPLWIANEPYTAAGRPVFGVSVDPGGVVTRIDLFTDAIATDEGIRLGDPAEAAFEAYPDATVIEGDLSDLLVVDGELGTLLLEIAREREIFDTPYWDEHQVDRVFFISAVLGHEQFSVAGSDNVAGRCPF